MRDLGIQGARRGRTVRTTMPGKDGQRAPDLLGRDFTAPAPNRRWVADFTYVPAWSGMVYVASSSTSTSAPSSAGAPPVISGPSWSWMPCRWRCGAATGTAGPPGLAWSITAMPGRSTPVSRSLHLIEAGIDASIGTVGDALDNALMESTIGLYKTELIKKNGPWKTLADVELATAGYVDWYSNRRLHTATGGIPPAEHEAAYYAQNQPHPGAGANN